LKRTLIGRLGVTLGLLVLVHLGSAAGADVSGLLDIILYPPGVAAVYPGELAPGWPESVPLPADAVLAGSLALKDDSLVAAFSLPRPIDGAADPYVTELQTRSWVLMGTEEDEEYRSYTFQRDGADLLDLVLYDVDGTVTYGLLYVGAGAVAALRTMMELVSDMLISLADVTVLPEFAFGEAEVVDEAVSPMSLFMDEETYQAKVRSDRDKTELVESLSTQLIGAGWKAVDAGTAGPTAWGRYVLEREGSTWRAILLVIAGEPRGTYFVSVHAYRIVRGPN